jgi:hypothetical protein
MNKHFEDAWYYLRRAWTHLTAGVREELAPAERRARRWVGRETEQEPSRGERVRRNVRDGRQTARERAKHAVRDVQERLETTSR